MASNIIGRTTCPECSFAGAHVKRSAKVLYRYCPECGSQHMARSKRQEADLLAKTRMLDAAPSSTATATDPTASAQTLPTVAPTAAVAVPPGTPMHAPPAAAAPVRRRGLFG